MRTRAYVIGYAILAIAGSGAAQEFHPDIPKAWDDKAVAGFEMPLAQRDRSPRYMTAEEYYKLEVRPVYRSYPMYVKGREPAGYIESLKQKEPEIIFEASKLHTKEDWIAAGKLVFESETLFLPAPAAGPTVSPSLPISSDGVLFPFFGYRYIVRKKGGIGSGDHFLCRVSHARDVRWLSVRRCSGRGRSTCFHCGSERNTRTYSGSVPAFCGRRLGLLWRTMDHEQGGVPEVVNQGRVHSGGGRPAPRRRSTPGDERLPPSPHPVPAWYSGHQVSGCDWLVT